METGTGAGTGRERGPKRGWRPVNDHKMETGTEAGTETRAVAEMEKGTRMRMGTRTRTGLGRSEERRRSATKRTRVVDAMWETGETLLERGNA